MRELIQFLLRWVTFLSKIYLYKPRAQNLFMTPTANGIIGKLCSSTGHVPPLVHKTCPTSTSLEALDSLQSWGICRCYSWWLESTSPYSCDCPTPVFQNQPSSHFCFLSHGSLDLYAMCILDLWHITFTILPIFIVCIDWCLLPLLRI